MTGADLPAELVRGDSGTYRVEGPTVELVRSLQAVGWRTGLLTLTGAGDRRTVLRGIGRALGFPNYYGANLDALWDCLTDLTQPTALVWQGWQGFAVEHSGDWAKVRAVLDARQDIEPSFALVLVP